jgi:hypothetical protein
MAPPFETIASERASVGLRLFLMLAPLQFFEAQRCVESNERAE